MKVEVSEEQLTKLVKEGQILSLQQVCLAETEALVWSALSISWMFISLVTLVFFRNPPHVGQILTEAVL